MALDADLIAESLEAAAERCADPAPLVYRRLFARRPEMEALFVRDTDGSVRGEMLSQVFEAILDFIGPRRYAANLIQCEVITHEGYGVPREIFGLFFAAVAEALAEILGPDWTPAIEAAWAALLAELGAYVAHPDQRAHQAA
ncbi:globin [Phenylobacterium montanum]|uniref:Globin n=1 Tax=Phenylobacterium montanum TaxID=2823693 RepID=A0A975G4C5_9CAUL|nr:globin [Caulobacter sp. S6]QUD90559.1 globin [Caulobacter sp. S6]